MSYLEFTSQFWEYNKKFPLGASASVIYIFLLDKGYKKKFEDFVLSDIEISKELKLSINTIKAAKEKLRDQGLIKYQTQNGLPCQYKLINDYSKGSIKKKEKEVDTILIGNNKEKSALKNKSVKKTNSRKADFKELENNLVDNNSVNSKPAIVVNPDIPSFDEFISFARNIKNYTSDLDSKIETKYTSWVNKGWKTDSNRPITNWKQVLKNIIPYIIDSDPYSEKQTISLPSIERSNLIKN